MNHISYPKIQRYMRPRVWVVTEKIDGTNGSVLVVPVEAPSMAEGPCTVVKVEAEHCKAPYAAVYAGSRSRWITPREDNHGFGSYVWDNANLIANTLPHGRHFHGEWWGHKIQRGYGLPSGERRFSLFYGDYPPFFLTDLEEIGWRHVPLLKTFGHPPTEEELSMFSSVSIAAACEGVEFEDPEGVIIEHEGARSRFKFTFDGDGHKGGR